MFKLGTCTPCHAEIVNPGSVSSNQSFECQWNSPCDGINTCCRILNISRCVTPVSQTSHPGSDSLLPGKSICCSIDATQTGITRGDRCLDLLFKGWTLQIITNMTPMFSPHNRSKHPPEISNILSTVLRVWVLRTDLSHENEDLIDNVLLS